jgi:hypothetical protein
MFPKCPETLLGILKMGLVKAANPITEFLVVERVIKGQARVGSCLTHLFNEQVIEFLLKLGLALQGTNLVVVGHYS